VKLLSIETFKFIEITQRIEYFCKMKEKIRNIIENNLNGYTLEKIILFGSRARGDFDINSDYDLYLVLKEKLSRDQKIELMDLLSGKLAEAEICSDIVIGNEENLQQNSENSDSILKFVAEEGQLI